MIKNIAKGLFTALGLLSAASVFAADQFIWVEAESGAEYNPIVVKSDPGASQKIYLASWGWPNYSTRSAAAGKISFSFYVPETGTYKLWARMRAPSGSRPYDISKDNGNMADNSLWTRWSTTPALTTWGWSDSGYTGTFTAGMHTIYLAQREGGPNIQLDKVLLTNNTTYVPSGVGTSEAVPNIVNPYKSNTVGKYGQLRVSGGKLLDKNNQPVQLQGVSAHGLQWFPIVGNQTIPYSVEYFGAEAVRLAMYIEDYAPTDPSDYWGGYTADKAAMMARVDAAIADAVDAGIYVLVDWHIHNTPGKYTSDATAFFSDIARRYGHLPNIIYEICNEPVGVSWSSGIKPYANTVINAIRQYDPDGIVIVGTPNWSQDVDAAAQDPLSFSNIMYAFHFYAATHDINTMKNKVQTALNAGLAIFVSEWGSSDVGTSRTDLNVAQQWMEFMNQKGLSWINWSLANKDEASSILIPTAPMSGPWADADLSAPGRWLKPYFDRPTASTATTSSSSSSSTSSGAAISSSSSSSGSTSVSTTKTVTLTTSSASNGITLNWAASNINVTQFEVYRDTDNVLTGRARLAIIGNNQFNYTDTSAAAGTTYYYSIKVIDTSNTAYNSIAVAGVLASASSSLPTSGNYKISNKLSNRVLDVQAKSTADGAKIQQYDFNGGENQKWRLNSMGADKFTIAALNSSKCLDVPNGTTNNGTTMQQYNCSYQNNQIWVLVPTNGYYQIRNVSSGKCLDIQNNSTANSTVIVQNDCSVTDSRLWKLDTI